MKIRKTDECMNCRRTDDEVKNYVLGVAKTIPLSNNKFRLEQRCVHRNFPEMGQIIVEMGMIRGRSPGEPQSFLVI